MNRLLAVIIGLGFVIWLGDPGGHPAATPMTTLPQTFRETSEPGDLNIVRRVERGRRPHAKDDAVAGVAGPWTTLQREANGHFYANAQVNGQTVRFIIDTGASSVALTEADARRIGIVLDPNNYQVVGTGASGEVWGQLVTLDRVTLDGKTVERVQGAVLDGLEISLLGQSFLGRMGKIEISSNTMTIR